jgi:hypothetical protein
MFTRTHSISHGKLIKIQDLITYTIVELNPLRVDEASVAEGKFICPLAFLPSPTNS